jgi:ubiquinone/menaquinone biosynthesis C-methylase UbiE
MMKTQPDWQWNEFQHIGADFSDLDEVEDYDRKHGQFRDVAAENRQILELLNLPKGVRVLDIGAGTGHFVRAAARAGLRPTAVDISTTMLGYARREAEKEGLNEIDYTHAGFLSFDFPEETFDAALTSAALHHLPDVWKAVALSNICRVLKPGGQFVLRDVVFGWGEEGHVIYCDKAIASLPKEMRSRMASHIAREYSTLNWIMEGLLERAGFTILSAEKPLSYFQVYHCRKD